MASPRDPSLLSAAHRRRTSDSRRVRVQRHLFVILSTASLLLLLVAQLIGSWPFAAQVAFAATKPKALPASQTFQQFEQLARQSAAQRTPAHWFNPRASTPLSKQEKAALATTHPLPPTAEPPTMQPMREILSTAFLSGAAGTQPLDLVGSDHRLEVIIPAGAFDLAHAAVTGAPSSTQHPQPTPTPGVTPTATTVQTPAATPSPTGTATPSSTPSPTPPVTPTVSVTPQPSPTTGTSSGALSGPLTLVISQQHGHFAGQVNELGQYQLQIVTAQNQPVSGVTLTQPITITYHYQSWEMTALDLDPGRTWLSWPNLAAAARAAHRSTSQDIILLTDNPKTQTLSAQSHVLDNGPFAVSGDPQNQSPAIPTAASVSGNSGQLSYSYPLQIAPAPAGFAPQLALSYSSGTPNSRQSVTSPAGDAGDGWALTLGSITAEVDPAGSAGGAQTWYFLSGVDGISDRLVPDPNHSGWYLTQHLSYLRIHQITSNNEPCFQVWDKSSTTFTFGCTPDSLQYRYDSNGLHLYRWDLDEMNAANFGSTSAEVKQINISYFQDCGSSSGNCTPASQASGSAAIRDAAVAQIQYGSGPASSFGTLSTISGTVDFYYWAPNAPSGSQFAQPYSQSYNGQSYGCSGNSSGTRCDDPQTEGSTNPPAVMSTLTLLAVTSYVGSDSGSGSHPAYQYQLTYQDSSSQDCTDPLSGTTISCAGEHLLTSVTPYVYQGGSANKLPSLQLDYVEHNNTYYDSTQMVGSHHYSVTTTWQYLADYSDTNTGVGEHIDYQTAYSNTHGTPYDTTSGDDRYDPTFCATHAGGSLDCGTYGSGQFAHPDDRAWAQQVVSDTKAFGIDSSAMSQPETTYAYVLEETTTDPNFCPTDYHVGAICVGDNWLPAGSQHDQDWGDFYHGVFQGFNKVNILSPANNLTVDVYFATDGWWSGSNDPDNAFNGDLEQEDVYQGPSTSGAHLVETVNTYAGADNGTTAIPCVSNISPYDPCEAIVYSSVTTTYNGSSASNPPQVTTTSSYDDYNPPSDSSQSQWSLNTSGYHNLLEQTVTGSNTPENPHPTITDQWTYTITDNGYNHSGWYTYDVNKVAHSEVDDNSGHKWQCQGITYDEGSGSSTPLAGWPTTVSTYTSANCTPGNYGQAMTTAYAGYDVSGNQVAAVDAEGSANAQFYGSSGISGKNGCTLQTAPAILSNAWTKSYYTTCTVYDSTYSALPTSATNAFNQTTTMAYDAGQNELPHTVTDVNGKATSYSYSYDSSGNRTVQVSEPGETSGYTSESVTHTSCASSIPTGAVTPCYRTNSDSSSYPTAKGRTYYDGLGRAVETRTPGPDSGYDTVQFTVSNDANQTSATSVPFEVTSGSSWVDPATAVDRNGHAPGVTITFYDAASRVIAVRDPLYGTLPGISCPPIGANATACTVYTLDSPHGSSTLYASAQAIDPNTHLSETFVDALGRTASTQEYSGLFQHSPTPVQQVSSIYDVLGQPTQVTTTDLAPQSGQNATSVSVTMSYDDLGRLTQLVDPDRGTHSYTYDADGRLLTDTSGTRVVGYNVDLLGRTGCVQDGAATLDADGSCTSGTTKLIQNTYDVTQIGTQGSSDFPVGRLTKSQSSSNYPEGGSTQSTEKYQYDNRGRVITEQLNLATPASWNLSLPTYQLAQTYTDADQPQTTQTSAINGQGQSTPQYTFTNVYDATLGVLTGLSSTTASQSNLASLSFTSNGLLGAFNYQSSTQSALATETFSYDGDLRPTEETATWQSGSGSTGTFFDEARGYDAASNVATMTTTLSQPNGQSGSNSMVQNFCYTEQNQLVWAGNSGTQPSAGNGTCGSGTLANTFSGGSYSSAFAYTHLGQLWQGPLNGTGANEQYLYCTSGQPHQLTDLVPAGQNSSCTNLPQSIPYTLAYNSWGDAKSRATSAGTATLSSNDFDQMVEWHIPNTNQAWYGYDASGTRTVQHTTVGSTSSTTIYAFGLEEYSYDGSGNLLSSTHYYSLAGHLLGELQLSGSTSTTTFFLTDGLGSVLGVFSDTASSAALLSTQLFTPYGTQLVANGSSIGQYTAKGFTGQYSDAVSGLDYYVSRYYDPVAGVFLSADTATGNIQGMNPYGYVGNNPETWRDPTGQYFAPPGNGNGGTPSCTQLGTCGSGNSSGYGSGSGGKFSTPFYNQPPFGKTNGQQNSNQNSCGGSIQADCTGATALASVPYEGETTVSVQVGGTPGVFCFGVCVTTFSGGVTVQVSIPVSGTAAVTAEVCTTPLSCIATHGGVDSNPIDDAQALDMDAGDTPAIDQALGEGCSFTAKTQVATDHGEQAIGTLTVGEQVLAYNPQTKKMEYQPILHVWLNHDTDLVDLTITSRQHAPHSTAVTTTHEVIHTNKKHPFFTEEQGFLPVAQITIGMHIVRADDSYGVVTGYRLVPGTAVMYNLTVAQDHTYTVGSGQWVVHNTGCGPTLPEQAESRAREIGNNIDTKVGTWNRSALTVGVAIVQDGDTVRTLVTTNEGASNSLVNLVDGELNVGEELVSLGDNQGRHAEEVLVQYTQQNGLNILGLGASNNFCKRCGPMLLQELGQEFLGQIYPSP